MNGRRTGLAGAAVVGGSEEEEKNKGRSKGRGEEGAVGVGRGPVAAGVRLHGGLDGHAVRSPRAGHTTHTGQVSKVEESEAGGGQRTRGVRSGGEARMGAGGVVGGRSAGAEVSGTAEPKVGGARGAESGGRNG